MATARLVLDELVNLVPINTKLLLFNHLKDVQSMIENIMVMHRRVFLTKLQEKPPTFFAKRKIGKFIDYISYKPGSFPATLPPLQDQFITKVVEYFIKTPQDFVKVAYYAFKKMRAEKYQRFCFSCISAVFGFYTSSEHLVFSRPFFLELSKEKDCDFVTSCLEPLFHSWTTYRYIKSIADFLFQGFCRDLLLTKEARKDISSEFIANLRREIIQRIALLPEVHVTVIKELAKNGFPKSRIFQFFIDQFIHSRLVLFFTGNGYEQLLLGLAEVMKALKMSSESEIERMFTAESSISVPSMFTDFDSNFVLCLISPRDVQTLYKTAINVIKFPVVLTMTMHEDFIHKQLYIPAFHRLYQRGRKTKSDIRIVFKEVGGVAETFDIPHFSKRFLSLRNLAMDSGKQPLEVLESKMTIQDLKFKDEEAVDLGALCDECRFKIMTDGDDSAVCPKCTKRNVSFCDYVVHQSLSETEELARKFEIFMGYLDGFENLQNQNNTVNLAWELALTPHCDVVTSSRTINKDDLEWCFTYLSAPLPKKIVYIAYLYRPLMEVWNSEWKRAVYLLEDRWRKVIALEPDDIPIREGECDTKHEKMMTRLNQIVTEFETITKVPEDHRYLLLARCLEILDMIMKAFGIRDEAVRYVLKKSSQSGLISVILICSALLMKNNDFQVLCSPSELSRWCEFEEVITNIVDMNDNLSNVYYSLQDEILMKFSEM